MLNLLTISMRGLRPRALQASAVSASTLGTDRAVLYQHRANADVHHGVRTVRNETDENVRCTFTDFPARMPEMRDLISRQFANDLRFFDSNAAFGMRLLEPSQP